MKFLRSPWFQIAVSALALSLAFHSPRFSALACIAFVPFFYSIQGKSPFESFRLGYAFGIFFFIATCYMIAYVHVAALLACAFYLALYPALFALFAHYFLDMSVETGHAYKVAHLRSVFFVPAIWTVLEYVRSLALGGAPWSLLAYTQWTRLEWIQWADVTGVYGVSYGVMGVNVILYKAIDAFRRRREIKALPDCGTHYRRYLAALVALLAAAAASAWLYGKAVLAARDHALIGAHRTARVSVLQGNVPQEQKWDARIKGIIFEKYKRLLLISAADKPDLVIWPETSFPGYLEDEPIFAAKLRGLIRQSGAEALVGAPTLGGLEKGLKFYNSAVHFGADGEERRRYHKVHLVPFGEYVPLEPLLGFVRAFAEIGRFQAGQELTVFEVGPDRLATRPKGGGTEAPQTPVRFSALICYEDMFPGLVRSFCRRGPDFLVNITNDAWFGKTSAPYQHAQASVFRAIENRIPVVRAANTGLSCFISAEGRILSSVWEQGEEIFVTGSRTETIRLRRPESFYMRTGDWFVVLAAALCYLARRDHARRSRYGVVDRKDE